ncbi:MULTISPECIES: ZIP family metal transporter [Pseudomonadaceae]|uniref:ZIP family metal transporter n=1 Tax=Pseudomonadaceae TaxID=135621 RepID=UPI003002CE92
MLLTITVILVVSGALLLGAVWGIYGRLPKPLEGFVVALAGGALMVSAVLELIEPAMRKAPLWQAFGFVLLGAAVFTGLAYLVKKKWGSGNGGGLLAAITLDGIPENLALGVALIGAGPLQVAALSGSIFLSNLPEAAGGARDMAASGHSRRKVLALWAGTAVILSLAALAGNLLMTEVPQAWLALIQCFAGGAVVASLATEVFPKAFTEDAYWAGVATAIGLILALYLNQLA